MLERAIEFFLRMVPYERCVDHRDPAAFIRPVAHHQDLGSLLHNGWGEIVSDLSLTASRHPQAYTLVNEEGEDLYEQMLCQGIMDELSRRNVSADRKTVMMILRTSFGHSDCNRSICCKLVALENQQ